MRKEYSIKHRACSMKVLLTGSLLVAMLMFSSFSAWAQDYERDYKTASDFFKEGKYNLAMAAYNPLVTYDQNNPYSEYASFYYALSAYRQNFPVVAKDMFIQMKKLYPAWEKMDEVNYWLAMIYFEQHEYFQGLLVLRSIQNPSYQQDIAQMKRHFLMNVDDTETLHMMLEEHPQDGEVALSLARAIARQPALKQDKAQLEMLISKFSMNKDEFIQVTALPSVLKPRYRVSLLFPFLTNTLVPTTGLKSNQSVLDIYEGMKIARDTLEKQNIHLDIVAYDTERNAETVKRLLDTDELKSSDLIANVIFRGPSSQQESALLLDFSDKYKVNVINPASSNVEFLGKSAFSWLYQPTHETLGVKAAEFINTRVHNKNCIVIYGDTPEDSVKAFGFIRTATALGMKVVLAEEHHRETSSKIVTTLATPTEFDEYKMPIQFALKRDSIGSIFVASDDPLIYAKVISSVEQRADSTVIIGNELWLQDLSLDYEKMERLRLVMTAPNFTPANNRELILFRKKYIQIHGVIPSNYAKMGYEFTLFAGHILQQYGVYFQNGFETETFIPGNLVKGYNFQQAHSNQLFSFIRFRNGELILAE